MTTALCLIAAVLLLAVYALGVSAVFTALGAMYILCGSPIPERVVYLAWRWPLVVIGVVK